MTNQADRNLRGFIPISMRVAAVLLFLFHLSIYPAPSVDGNQDEDTKSKLNKLFEMSVEDLLKVEITTAGKTEEKVGDIPASVVVISREEIERYGYSSVAEILENVPGLYNIDSRAANGAVFGVRGYWTGVPRNFIVLVNGVEQADSHGTYHLQNFNLPVEAIDRIEVVRGPMSVMYGSDAFFGAINIITNMPAEEDAATLASVSFGSEKSKRGALRYAFTGDDLTVVFNAGYYDTYGPNEPLGTMVSDLSNLSFFNISEANNNTTTGGRLENSNVYFSLSAKYKEFFADVSLNRSAREEYHFWPSFSDGLLHKKKFTTAAFGYKKEFSDSFSIKGSFKYYLSSYWREFDYFIEDFFGQEIAHSEKYDFELNTEYSPTENFKILTGLTYKVMDSNFKLDLRSIFLLSVGEETRNFGNIALFAQANYSPSQKLKFVAGLRLEKPLKYRLRHQDNEYSNFFESEYEIKKIEVVPRFAVLFSLNDHNVVKLLYGKAVKLPSYADVLRQKTTGGINLESEYINTLELNYLSTVSSKLSLNVSLFRNSLDNLIVTKLQFGDQGNWAPIPSNSGKLVTHGAELMIYAKPFNNLLVELSGSYQETKDKRQGIENHGVGYSPNFLGYVKASYSFGTDITFALTGKYIGEMETLWDVGKLAPNNTGDLGARIGPKVDGYFTLDGNLRFNNLFKKGYFLNVRCSNLFNTAYLYPMYTNNTPWVDKGIFGHGRAFFISVGRKF